ncbi:MAG: sigma 54-interacting transcriptional regulator [Polyangiaceae bacterium]
MFLDEIGDLTSPAQAKLLRALQEGEIHFVGSDSTVRVTTASSLPATRISVESAAGRFREDLFYRLHVGSIDVPRSAPAVATSSFSPPASSPEAARRLHKPVTGFTPAALTALLRHSWPGNVRELQNESERAAIVSPGPLSTP